MDKGGLHPLRTAVDTGEPFLGSPANVSSLSRLVLDLAPPLLASPSYGGPSKMVIVARPAEVLTTNAYCTTCLRTRRFYDRPTHLVCETCSKRLDKVSPDRGARALPG